MIDEGDDRDTHERRERIATRIQALESEPRERKRERTTIFVDDEEGSSLDFSLSPCLAAKVNHTIKANILGDAVVVRTSERDRVGFPFHEPHHHLAFSLTLVSSSSSSLTCDD